MLASGFVYGVAVRGNCWAYFTVRSAACTWTQLSAFAQVAVGAAAVMLAIAPDLMKKLRRQGQQFSQRSQLLLH